MMLGRNTGVLQCTGFLCRSGKLLTINNSTASCLCEAGIPEHPLASFGFMMPGGALFLGFAMWGFGCWVLFMAASTSLYHTKTFNLLLDCFRDEKEADSKAMPFNVPWWGMVFPLVTLTMSTYQLHTDTEWAFFKWMGRFFGAAVFVSASYVHFKTLQHVIRGDFWRKFHAA